MPIVRPGVLTVDSTSYDLTKAVAWWPADESGYTRVRLLTSSGDESVVSLPTVDFEAAMSGGGSASAADLLTAATSTGAGATTLVSGEKRTYQATITGTGALTATVAIQVSNDGTNWITQSTITLSGTGYDTDGAALEAPWPYVRGNVTAITGTAAAVTLTVHTAE